MVLKQQRTSMLVFRLGILFVAGGALGLEASAYAESDTVVVSESTLEVLTESQTKSRIALLERAYERAHPKRSRAGVTVSAILIAGGATMIAISETARGFIVVGGDAPGSNAFTTIGSAMVVASTIGLVLASRRLKKKKAERRRLQEQIADLERSRQAP